MTSNNKDPQDFRVLSFLSIIFLHFSLFINVPLGFDIYSHSIEVVSYRNKLHEIEAFINFSLKRYLLLSYIYDVSNNLGIGVVPIAYILTVIPSIALTRNAIEGRFNPFIFVVMLWATVLYSASGLSVLYFITYLTTQKKFFLCGLFFSPLGCIFLIVYLVFVCIHRAYKNILSFDLTAKTTSKLVIYVLAVLCLIFVLISQNQIINLILEKKIIEVNVFILFLITSLIIKKIKFNEYYKRIFLFFNFVIVYPSIILLQATYFSDKTNIANSLLRSNMSPIVEYGIFGGFSDASFETLFKLRARND